MPASPLPSSNSSGFPALLRQISAAFVTLLIGGFLGAALIRFSPGYDADLRDVDPRYSAAARAAIHAENSGGENLLVFYRHYLARALHGDFGMSRAFDTPVSNLLASRAGTTLRLIGWGLALGWAVGLALAALAAFTSQPLVFLGTEALNGLSLSLPAAVFALLIFLARGPVAPVIALVIFPRVFRYARDMFGRARHGSLIEAARSRGIPESTIFLHYVMRPAWAPLIALAGVSFSIAFGAAIPVEAVCGIPGLGQLALNAAVGRDLPVLVSLTLIVTAITITVNLAADLTAQAVRA